MSGESVKVDQLKKQLNMLLVKDNYNLSRNSFLLNLTLTRPTTDTSCCTGVCSH